MPYKFGGGRRRINGTQRRRGLGGLNGLWEVGGGEKMGNIIHKIWAIQVSGA